MTDKRTYQRYSPEFKREAVRQLTDTDKSCTQLARELGIRVSQLAATAFISGVHDAF